MHVCAQHSHPSGGASNDCLLTPNVALGSWADEMEDMPMPGKSLNQARRASYADFASVASMLFQVDDTLEVETNSLKAHVQITAWVTDHSVQHRHMATADLVEMTPHRPSVAIALTYSADRGGYSVREQLPLPSKPPYTVHLGNMSFDATEGDVEDFFAGCEVTNVRIVEDKMDRKPKGFGYAEFASLDGLKKALDLSGKQFQGRNIRISVAEPRKSNTLTCDSFLADASQKRIAQMLGNSTTGPAKDHFRTYQVNAVCLIVAGSLLVEVSTTSRKLGATEAHAVPLNKAMARSEILEIGSVRGRFNLPPQHLQGLHGRR